MGLELVELRAHFGVSATEALNQMPSWEYELLVDAIRHQDTRDEPQAPTDTAEVDLDGPPADPPVPDALRGMF